MERRSRHTCSRDAFIFSNPATFSHILVAAKRILPAIFENITFDVLWEPSILF